MHETGRTCEIKLMKMMPKKNWITDKAKNKARKGTKRQTEQKSKFI